MWRRLKPDESFVYDFVPRGHGYVIGYGIEVSILLWNHNQCSCLRSTQPETILMFLEHPNDAMTEWPLYYTVTNEWLVDISRNGFGIQLPGWIVGIHGTISYGYLHRS